MNENEVHKFLLLLDWPKTTPISDFDMVFRAGILFSLDAVVLIVVCCALQLFAIFMAEKLVGPRCPPSVQIVSKRLVSQTSYSIVK